MSHSTADRNTRRVAALLLVGGGILPLVVYWLVLGRVPSVTPDEARQILGQPGSGAVLVDVRSPERFAASHLEGAHNWPYQRVAAVYSAKDVPEHLRGRRLLLVCDSGITSALAAGKLERLSVGEVANVVGGMQAWVGSADKPCGLSYCRLQQASGKTSDLPFQESSLLEQWATVLTGFVVKPMYTLIALALAVVLWRQKSPDLVALRWAFVFFFVGENFCAANYLLYGHQSHLFEYLHSLGMVVCFGLTTYALLEGLDRRLVKFSDASARCAALALCRRCIKYTDAPCGLKRTFLFLIPACMVLAWIPLTADPAALSYNTEIFGTFYNQSHPVIYQLFEVRYCPVVALVLLAVSLIVLKLKKHEPVHWSKVFFSAGVGALGFSFFRLVFAQVYRDNLAWFGVWEEVTELLFVVGAGLVLWAFRHGLFAQEPRKSPASHDKPSAGELSPSATSTGPIDGS